MVKLVYGVGINDAGYNVNYIEGGKRKRCKIYTHWKNMMSRCYSTNRQTRQPTYKGCSVDPRWWSFSTFREWMLLQDWEGKHLDKDLRVHGNQVYGPDTCIMIDGKLNGIVKPTTLYGVYKGFWVLLKEFYKNDETSARYSYAYKHFNVTNDLEELERMREYATSGKRVIWEGEDRSLIELCEEWGSDYNSVLDRLSCWGTTVYACVVYRNKCNYSYEVTADCGAAYPAKSHAELSEITSIPASRVAEYYNKTSRISEMQSLYKLEKYDGRVLHNIHGVSKYREEWILHCETTESRVSSNITKYGIPFEQAVQLPVERIMKVLVNGEVLPVQQLWEKFGITPRKANRWRSANSETFLTTLSHFGVDTKEITLSVI